METKNKGFWNKSDLPLYKTVWRGIWGPKKICSSKLRNEMKVDFAVDSKVLNGGSELDEEGICNILFISNRGKRGYLC